MKKYFNELFEYEFWANDEIIKFILTLHNPPEKLLSVMSHIINAQILWLCRLQGKITDVKVWQLYDKYGLDKISKNTAINLNEY